MLLLLCCLPFTPDHDINCLGRGLSLYGIILTSLFVFGVLRQTIPLDLDLDCILMLDGFVGGVVMTLIVVGLFYVFNRRILHLFFLLLRVEDLRRSVIASASFRTERRSLASMDSLMAWRSWNCIPTR